MNKELNKLIRQKMRDCGVWNFTVNTKIYTTEQFISEFGDKMPNDLIDLLNVCNSFTVLFRSPCFSAERITS